MLASKLLLVFFMAMNIAYSQDYRAKKKEIEKEIAREKAKIKTIERDYQSQQKIVLDEERKLSKITRKLQDGKKEEKLAHQNVEKLNLLVAKNDAKYNSQIEHIKNIYLLRWQVLNQNYSSLLLSLQGINKARRYQMQLGLLQAMTQTEIASKENIQKSVAEQKKLISSRKKNLTLLSNIRATYQQQVAEEQNSQARKEKEVAKLKKIINRSKRKLKIKENTYKKLLATIKRLQRDSSLGKTSQFSSAQGTLRWPVSGTIFSKAGWKDSSGIEFSVKAGTYVHAVHDGKVVFADAFPGFNMLVIIDHGRGYYTLYGYNQSLFKDEGDIVKADEIIAIVGNNYGLQHNKQASTRVLKDLAYFEIRKKSQSIDPLKWLRRSP